MERNNRRKNNNLRNEKLYYIAGGIAISIIIVFSIVYLAIDNSRNNESQIIESQKFSDKYNNTTSEEASTKIGKTVEESANETNTTTEKIALNTSIMNTTKEEDKKTKNTIKENKTKESTNTKKEEKTVETAAIELSFEKPVEGEIIKEYAKDNLIYSETLNEWITHNGIDIKAEKAQVVKSAEAGTVKAIKNDPRYGITITIEHENGYKTVYANLLTTEFVVEGEKVEKGQTIGTVGNTAVFESGEEPHLHFEILKDNEYIDPNTMLK